jgi:hypothetical protein
LLESISQTFGGRTVSAPVPRTAPVLTWRVPVLRKSAPIVELVAVLAVVAKTPGPLRTRVPRPSSMVIESPAFNATLLLSGMDLPGG